MPLYASGSLALPTRPPGYPASVYVPARTKVSDRPPSRSSISPAGTCTSAASSTGRFGPARPSYPRKARSWILSAGRPSRGESKSRQLRRVSRGKGAEGKLGPPTRATEMSLNLGPEPVRLDRRPSSRECVGRSDGEGPGSVRDVEPVRQLPPEDTPVIPLATPVIAFGDPGPARVATIGINPSAREFLEDGRLLAGS